MTKVPKPTPIYRFMHIDNLETCVKHCGLYAPNCTPQDALPYKTIHDVEIQTIRTQRKVTCGPKGVIHDYVPFYFGVLSPMLLKLKTGQVNDYNEGQEPLIYLMTTVESVVQNGLQFAFSDGHGIALFTSWYDDLTKLNEVDWGGG